MATQFKCDAQTRALEVERKIWEQIDAGKLTLENGVYQRDHGEAGCHACAVGSAALAVCGINNEGFGSPKLRDALADKGVMTHVESYAMERGFEAAKPLDGLDAHMKATANALWPGEPRFEGLCEDSPFYQLGVRLRGRMRPK